MISKLVWLSAFLGALLGAALGPQAVAASASAPVSAPANADNHFNRGMLWRIQPKRGAPSYLFGTLHSDDPRVLALPTPVVTALEQAKSVTLELLLDRGAY